MFKIAIVLFVLALIALFVSFVVKNPVNPTPADVPGRTVARVLTGFFVLVGVILLVLSSFATVGAKQLGVLTTFGKPTGHLTNGLHVKAPWQKVTKLTDAVQTDTYATDSESGKQQQGAAATCVHVRLARQATACANVSIRWQIKATGVDYVFRNYKDNAALTDNLVLRDLQTAMNEAFADYDPLGVDANGQSTNEPLSVALAKGAKVSDGQSISNDVLLQMQREIGAYIDVQLVNVPLINYDGATQSKVNLLQQQVAQTRIAQQAILTNQAQAQANSALAASVNNDPGVLTSKCLDILQEAVNKGQALPAGFSCFGATTTAVAVK